MTFNWLAIVAALGVVAGLYVGGRIVAAIEDLRVALGDASTGLTQVGTDLLELLDRIAAAAEVGDPTAEDVATARALADGLVATGAQIDAILAAPVPDPDPEPSPEG